MHLCREILWEQAAAPLSIPTNANVTLQCNGAAISTFHPGGPVAMGPNSSLTFSDCNVTTTASAALALRADSSSPFAAFQGDHTATVTLVNSVARFSHSVRPTRLAGCGACCHGSRGNGQYSTTINRF